MSLPFDATSKYLIEHYAADWLPLSGRASTGRVEVIEAELSTVTASADRVLRVHDDPPWLLHLEPQVSREKDLPGRLHWYNGLLERKFGPPVWTVVVLMRKDADAANVTGVLERRMGDNEPPYLVFRYQVVRLWELPVDFFLRGGLGLLPLAPLSAVGRSALPAVVEQLEARIQREAPPEDAGQLWTAAGVLMGLKYPPTFIAKVLEGVRGMKESSFYQMILKEGRVEGAIVEAKQLLLRLGRKRFGLPKKAIVTAIEKMQDKNKLEELVERALEVSSWQELLETP